MPWNGNMLPGAPHSRAKREPKNPLIVSIRIALAHPLRPLHFPETKKPESHSSSPTAEQKVARNGMEILFKERHDQIEISVLVIFLRRKAQRPGIEAFTPPSSAYDCQKRAGIGVK
jgi:hypothetical protein